MPGANSGLDKLEGKVTAANLRETRGFSDGSPFDGATYHRQRPDIERPRKASKNPSWISLEQLALPCSIFIIRSAPIEFLDGSVG